MANAVAKEKTNESNARTNDQTKVASTGAMDKPEVDRDETDIVITETSEEETVRKKWPIQGNG